MSEHRETFVIEETLLNERLDVWLSSKYPEVSRGTIVRLIKDGEIRVNDQQVKPNPARAWANRSLCIFRRRRRPT